MTHEGSCHCGRVTFEVDGEPSKLIECNCSHCSRKAYLLWFVPSAQFRLLRGEADLATYQFNKHAIDHRFCTTCGCAPFATGEDPASGVMMVGVNVHCLPQLDHAALEVQHVDGRSL